MNIVLDECLQPQSVVETDVSVEPRIFWLEYGILSNAYPINLVGKIYAENNGIYSATHTFDASGTPINLISGDSPFVTNLMAKPLCAIWFGGWSVVTIGWDKYPGEHSLHVSYSYEEMKENTVYIKPNWMKEGF